MIKVSSLSNELNFKHNYIEILLFLISCLADWKDIVNWYINEIKGPFLLI